MCVSVSVFAFLSMCVCVCYFCVRVCVVAIDGGEVSKGDTPPDSPLEASMRARECVSEFGNKRSCVQNQR